MLDLFEILLPIVNIVLMNTHIIIMLTKWSKESVKAKLLLTVLDGLIVATTIGTLICKIISDKGIAIISAQLILWGVLFISNLLEYIFIRQEEMKKNLNTVSNEDGNILALYKKNGKSVKF